MKLLRIRDLSVGFKLWLLFTCFTVPCILLFGWCSEMTLGYTRDETAWSVIEKAQAALKGSLPDGAVGKSEAYDATVSVYHIGIVDRKVQYITYPAANYDTVLTPLIETMGASFSRQADGTRRYKSAGKEYVLYYIIAKKGNDGVISFKTDVPFDRTYHDAFLLLTAFTLAALVLAVGFAFLAMRVFLRTFRRFERSIDRIAGGDLKTPAVLDRGDEFGRLSQKLDSMRVKLERRDLLRQSELQFVSHELKTPIMTIASYAQAVLDRVYPRGSLEETVRVIISQSERLRVTVMKLLSLTKLDYLEELSRKAERVDLHALCEGTAARLCASRPELCCNFAFDEAFALGSREQLGVLFENLFENALRHAHSCLRAALSGGSEGAVFTIYNDGGGIDEALMPKLFDAFAKGEGGVSGLGLWIVRRAADSCGAAVSVRNTDGGVEFTVRFPAVLP